MNLKESSSLIAIQGPQAAKILEKIIMKSERKKISFIINLLKRKKLNKLIHFQLAIITFKIL